MQFFFRFCKRPIVLNSELCDGFRYYSSTIIIIMIGVIAFATPLNELALQNSLSAHSTLLSKTSFTPASPRELLFFPVVIQFKLLVLCWEPVSPIRLQIWAPVLASHCAICMRSVLRKALHFQFIISAMAVHIGTLPRKGVLVQILILCTLKVSVNEGPIK